MNTDIAKQMEMVLYRTEDDNITDNFAECSIDYDKNSEITYRFYTTIQNEFL